MSTNNCPKRMWDYALVYEAEILSIIARGKDGVPGLEKITGETVDITEYLDFAFWDLVWYGSDLNKEGPTLGRWLGVSHCIGSALCYHILKVNSSVELRTTVQHVTQDDYALPGAKECIQCFDDDLIERLKDDNFTLSEGEDPIYGVEDVMDSIEDNDNIYFLEENDLNMKRAVKRYDYNDGAYDALLTAKVRLLNDNADRFIRGTVIK